MDDFPKVSIPVSLRVFLWVLIAVNIGSFFAAAAQPHGAWGWLTFGGLFVANIGSSILQRLVPTQKQQGAKAVAKAAMRRKAVDVAEILTEAESSRSEVP